MYNDYQASFTSRLAQIKSDDNILSSLKDQIQGTDNQISSLLRLINTASKSLDNEKSSGNYTAYNFGVPKFNSMVNKYNSLVTLVSTEISRYNNLVSDRNSLALQEHQLAKAITSIPNHKLPK